MTDSSVRIDKDTMKLLEEEKLKQRKSTGRKIYIRGLISNAVKKCYGGSK